jgi:hypothetical protein
MTPQPTSGALPPQSGGLPAPTGYPYVYDYYSPGYSDFSPAEPTPEVGGDVFEIELEDGSVWLALIDEAGNLWLEDADGNLWLGYFDESGQLWLEPADSFEVAEQEAEEPADYLNEGWGG